MAWKLPWGAGARRSPLPGVTGAKSPERSLDGRLFPLENDLPPSLGVAGIVDVETTGLSPRRDEIVELALILFAFDRTTGHIKGIVDEYSGLREPSVPISPGASRVNGITWEMVRGRRLDEPRVEQMLRRAEFLVAHNAPFDRSFLTGLFPMAGEKPWACSMRNVDWRGMGFDSAALQTLLRHHGIMAERAHRGSEDAHATLALLSRTGPDDRPYFYWLLRSCQPQPGGSGLARLRPRWARPGPPQHSL